MQLRLFWSNLKFKNFLFSSTFCLRKPPCDCLLCKINLVGMEKVKCPTPNCIGLYCRSCYTTIKFCSICLDPAEYGDMSDVSEEK